MSDLYEHDILLWSEEQARLLRARAEGRAHNEAEIDWPNIIEEIESVGSEQLHAVQSYLVQALVHMLKIQAWPDARDAENWRAEAARFCGDAARRFTPSMRQKIDIAELYADARRAMPRKMYGLAPQYAEPRECPWTLDDLLNTAQTLDDLLRKR